MISIEQVSSSFTEMRQKGIDLNHDFLLNNAVQKMRTRVTNTISLYKLTNAHFLLFYRLRVILYEMKYISDFITVLC